MNLRKIDSLKSAASLRNMMMEVADFFEQCEKDGIPHQMRWDLIEEAKALAAADEDAAAALVARMMEFEQIARDMEE